MGNSVLNQSESAASCDRWAAPDELRDQLRIVKSPAGLDRQQSILASIVQNEIVPRLVLANRSELAIAPPVSDATAAGLLERVGEFSELVIKQDAETSIIYFEKLRQEGASIESLFQNLLAPTARRLGELWDEDINDFFDVTRGLGHLRDIVHVFSSKFCEENSRPISNRRALMMPLPGDQHTFGLALICEHFRRDGWRVWSGPSQSLDDIIRLVAEQWFEVVGLSGSAIADRNKLAADIQLIRRSSLNKNVCIFVGGHVFSENPDIVAAVGADATAMDGHTAILQVTKLLGTGKQQT